MYAEESIYNIIPPKVTVQEKQPMHKSKHSHATPPTASTFHTGGTHMPIVSNLGGDMTDKPVVDKSARIMGKAPGTTRNDPNNYMKKYAKTDKIQSLAEVKQTSPEQLQPTKLAPKHKPSVPKRDEQPVMNLVTSKNYVVANAVETILAAPKKITDGAKDFLNKEDYGKVPKYLAHVKKDIDAEFEYIRQLQQAQADASKPQVRAMDEAERLQLIDGLKAKWESVNTEYQATTHLTKLDTMGKIKRKEKFEAQLAQIEKDIEKLNRKNIIIDASY